VRRFSGCYLRGGLSSSSAPLKNSGDLPAGCYTSTSTIDESGDVVFRHACNSALRESCVAARLALCLRPALGQEQESGSASAEAGGGGDWGR
jgi:hypothetical protein